MAFMGMTPFGSLMAGTLASRIGTPNTFLVGGLMCLAGAAWFTFQLSGMRELLRPIYVEKGILPGGSEAGQ
jgi:hypothetical protein